MTVTALPRPAPTAAPGTARWRPTRAGLLNVWRYYDEVLEFAGGRLLLRGANGSGKSKALELLLPFLLDANLRAQRLSTFGTGERTMHWNLMGQGASGTTRVGYVWVEFGAADDEGAGWFTAGARLQASTHSSQVHADYFTTDQRVGHDLALTTDNGTPLTRVQLDEALADRGTRHEHGHDHRRAVRQALFPGMTEQRYDALITALLQLRTPKLSQRLDPALLSTLLSRALPPLGEGEVADLAEGFERLDRQREHLARLDAEAAAAQRLAEQQRSYARRVLRARASAVVRATSDMDGRTRTARLSEQHHVEALAERDAAEERARELAERAEALEARLEALRDSDAYREGVVLEELRARLDDTRRALATARAAHEAATNLADADAAQAETAREHARTADALGATRLEETRRAARDAGLATTLTQVEAGGGRGLLQGAVESRRHLIGEVRGHLDTWDRAVAVRADREADLDQARAALVEATAARAAAEERAEAALSAQAFRLESWLRQTRELAGPETVEGLIDAVLADVASEAAVVAAVEAAAGAVRRELDRAEATGAADRDRTAAERGRVQDEHDRVAGEREIAPSPPPTRRADRSARSGAPLWRLVAFADGVDERTAATVEAALQAAGLLDAWVTPSGRLEGHAGHDTLVTELAPAPGASLLEVVVPDPDAATDAAAAVDPDVLRRVLGGVAYSEDLDAHPAVVTPDGRFRLASLTGSWSKDEAEHVGARARERARARRLAQLTRELAELDRALAARDAELARLERRRGRLDADLAGRPDHRELDAAHDARRHADAAVAASDRAVRRGVDRRAEAEATVAAALRALTAHAAEHGLPAERVALDQLARALDTFGHLAVLWLDAEAAARHARERAEQAGEAARRSADAVEQRAGEVETARGEERRLAERVQTVQATVGADYQEVLATIAATREENAAARREAATVAARRRELEGRIGELSATRAHDRERQDEAVAARDTAAEGFRAVWHLGLPADAGVAEAELAGPGTKATLELARSVAGAWPDVRHEPRHIADALGRLQQTLHESRESLGARADLVLETEDDVQVLRAVLDGRTVGARALAEAIGTEAERSRHDITGAERDLFDTTLTGETRRHLAARIREADALVRSMNERLGGVRTASDVAVRLRWTVADDVAPGTRVARDLLLKDPVRLDDDDRAALHRFFRDRIDAARAEGTAGSWEQQLAEVFDYTRWHQFVVELDRGDGAWQKLTRKLHGALSGGEKAIALHLPLFAAVSAYYESVPGSPRLILLDEVFVGVDEINRGQVFGLLAALDLDLVLTSDHEWCLYREIDAIAVHQLITGIDDTDDAVTTARWVWNGRALEEA
jgi:uncharacterized protein (TIGR02680 family)